MPTLEWQKRTDGIYQYGEGASSWFIESHGEEGVMLTLPNGVQHGPFMCIHDAASFALTIMPEESEVRMQTTEKRRLTRVLNVPQLSPTDYRLWRDAYDKRGKYPAEFERVFVSLWLEQEERNSNGDIKE
jgi:hypothetical protein